MGERWTGALLLAGGGLVCWKTTHQHHGAANSFLRCKNQIWRFWTHLNSSFRRVMKSGLRIVLPKNEVGAAKRRQLQFSPSRCKVNSSVLVGTKRWHVPKMPNWLWIQTKELSPLSVSCYRAAPLDEAKPRHKIWHVFKDLVFCFMFTKMVEYRHNSHARSCPQGRTKIRVRSIVF